MQAKLLATTLIAATAALVLCYPMFRSEATVVPNPPGPVAAQAGRIEVVFVLDTTSSMSGLIATAKEKIWSIASTMAQAEQAPEIHMGLVAFRDRSDDYVTQVVDLSTDLDSMYSTLMGFAAAGGGDGPESVNAALHDAVHGISWSRDSSAYRAIFLVGDAPPHMDYAGQAQYPQIVAEAVARGIVVNTIQCGDVSATVDHWTRIAGLGNGRYLKVDQSGGAMAVATPFDRELAELSAQLDDTRLFYGDAGARRRFEEKAEASRRLARTASVSSRARRAVFNATPSGAINAYGESDLVGDVAAGRVALEDLDEWQLPEDLQGLGAGEREAAVAEVAERRAELSRQIEALSVERSDYIETRVGASDAAAESLDVQLYELIREQGARVNLDYSEGPQY